jgi:DNA-binding NarL/FixJ family response regulator
MESNDRMLEIAVPTYADSHHDAGVSPVTYVGQNLPPHLRVYQSKLTLLTPRERTILRMLAVGMGNRSVAGTLGISEATVKRHLTALLAKLSVDSRLKAGLIALAACLAGQLEWHESIID